MLLAGNIERQSNFIWQKKWTWTYGAELLATDERGAFSPAGLKGTRTFLIAALPVGLGYDGSDNLLDPTHGFRLSARVSPELSARWKLRLCAGPSSTPAPITRCPIASLPPVASGSARSSARESSTSLRPAVSIRAEGVRSGATVTNVGPKDADGDPMGGRGLAEFGLEARIRLEQFGGNFGIVPFFDGGSLTTKVLPDFSNWRFAAGSAFAIIRVSGPSGSTSAFRSTGRRATGRSP